MYLINIIKNLSMKVGSGLVDLLPTKTREFFKPGVAYYDLKYTHEYSHPKYR